MDGVWVWAGWHETTKINRIHTYGFELNTGLNNNSRAQHITRNERWKTFWIGLLYWSSSSGGDAQKKTKELLHQRPSSKKHFVNAHFSSVFFFYRLCSRPSQSAHTAFSITVTQASYHFTKKLGGVQFQSQLRAISCSVYMFWYFHKPFPIPVLKCIFPIVFCCCCWN